MCAWRPATERGVCGRMFFYFGIGLVHVLLYRRIETLIFPDCRRECQDEQKRQKTR
jgi:hypothetical protein